jgi:pyridoxine/pyridoxamine 5'-phosphate oxidase
MGSPHLEEELIGGDCNLDLLFQIPQKYARIIGGKGEEASSRGSTMEEREMLKNTLRTLETVGEESPFIANQNMAIGAKVWANPVETWCRRALRRHSRCTAR